MKNETKWIRITYPHNIPLREGRAVRIGENEIAIFNLGDRFLAIENRCPHREGPLAEGIVSGTTIVCPLHAWKFSLETGRGASPASSAHCVRSFRTRVEDNVIWLALPANFFTESLAALGCMEPQAEVATEARSTASV